MSDYSDLVAVLKGSWNIEAAYALEAQARLITELEAAMREIYEVYAGSEGFIPETCAEGYQQHLIKEMSDIAAKHMRKGLEKKK